MAVARRIVAVLLLGLITVPQAKALGTGYVFVSNEQMNSVAVIDLKQDGRVIKWIETSRRPLDMKFRHNRKQLLVACAADDVIDVIDIATLSVIDHIPTGADPEVFALSRDEETLYVTNKADSAVEVISVAEKIIEHEIPTGAGPDGIVLSDDGKTLYVTSELGDWVHVIDLEADAVIDNIVVGERPRRFVLLPAQLWVSNELSGQVSIIDRGTNRVLANIDFFPPGSDPTDVTPFGMTATKDGGTVFVSLGRADAVAFVDTATRAIRHYVAVGRGAWGLALSSDDTTLYVANVLSDDVSIIDVPSHTVVRAVPVGSAPRSALVDDLTEAPPTTASSGTSTLSNLRE